MPEEISEREMKSINKIRDKLYEHPNVLAVAIIEDKGVPAIFVKRESVERGGD
ncbi:MAG: hypothetical protein WC533_00030 [Candidatus Pacearchaeota archaeon]